MKYTDPETGKPRNLESLADHYAGAIGIFVQTLANDAEVPVYAKVWFGNTEESKGIPIGQHRTPKN